HIERERKSGLEFGQSLGLIQFGLYHEAVRRYREQFPAEQLRVYLYDDFRADPRTLLRDLLTFIGVDLGHPIDVSAEVNRPLTPRFRSFHARLANLQAALPGLRLVPSTRWTLTRYYWDMEARPPRLSSPDADLLREIFARDIMALSALIGRDLSHWLHAKGRPEPAGGGPAGMAAT
ncbi:MAG TPA: hypothetical protein VGI83_03175, partial [Gemmatimonadales bacterium]